MILGDVLHILKEEGKAFCNSNQTLYKLLFIKDNDNADYEDPAKKAFSKGGLSADLQAQLCKEANFYQLCERIEQG